MSRPGCLPAARGRRGAAPGPARGPARPPSERPWIVAQAFREGFSVEEVASLSAIDPWFLRRICALVLEETQARRLRRRGQAARGDAARGQEPGLQRPPAGAALRTSRSRTCARCATALGVASGLQAAWTPAPRSSRPTRPTSTPPTSRRTRPPPTDRKKVMILGGGPNRIGQGIEFDYCCVHAAFALREAGYETHHGQLATRRPSPPTTTPATASTSSRSRSRTCSTIARARRSRMGVIVQFGGQTPLNLAVPLEQAGLPILGTSRGGHRPRRGPRALRAR